MVDKSKPKEVKIIDFFAGIGAWELAAEIINNEPDCKVNFKTIEFIEINPYAQKVLQKHYPLIPIHSDVKTYQPKLLETDIYLISFPCTGTSIAGKRTGLNHPESNLWYESLRCICQGRPRFIVIEQPEGFINRGLRAVIAGLRMAGYQAEVEIITAAQFGAPHKRSRVFIIAHANNIRLTEKQTWRCWSEQISSDIEEARQIISYSSSQSSRTRLDDGIPPWLGGVEFSGWWRANQPPENAGVVKQSKSSLIPSLNRQAITLYGKSIVPLQAAIALRRLATLIELSSDTFV